MSLVAEMLPYLTDTHAALHTLLLVVTTQWSDPASFENMVEITRHFTILLPALCLYGATKFAERLVLCSRPLVYCSRLLYYVRSPMPLDFVPGSHTLISLCHTTCNHAAYFVLYAVHVLIIPRLTCRY